MALQISAVYQNGNLKLLEPVDLQEGQQVRITIESSDETETMRAALGDLVIWPDPDDDSYPETEAMAEEIAQAFTVGKSLSEMIIEDRGEI